MKRIQIKILLKRHNTILGLVSIIILAACINKSFLILENLTNVLRQASMDKMIAVGMTMVITCGSIDLSMGTMIGLCGYIALYFSSYSLVLAVTVPLLTGVIAGTVNGFLTNRIKTAPLVATLAAVMAVKGTTFVLTNENTYFASNSTEQFQYIERGLLALYVTVPPVMSIRCVAVRAYILRHTMLRRNMYAVGGNTEMAEMMGVDVEEILMFSHISTGGIAALAGITPVSRVGTAYSLVGEGKELDVIAVCVISGTTLTSGEDYISSTLTGVLIMGMLTNIFSTQSLLNPFWEKVIIDILVLVVVLIQLVSESGATFGKNIKILMKGKA